MYENGILNPTASHPPPQGLDTIRHYLTQRRTSTHPSEHAHQRYCKKVSTSDNEDKVSFLIQADIMKRYDYSDPQYDRTHSRAITRIPPRILITAYLTPFPISWKASTQRFYPITCAATLSTPKTRFLSLTSLPNLSVQMAISTRQHTRLRTTVLC